MHLDSHSCLTGYTMSSFPIRKVEYKESIVLFSCMYVIAWILRFLSLIWKAQGNDILLKWKLVCQGQGNVIRALNFNFIFLFIFSTVGPFLTLAIFLWRCPNKANRLLRPNLPISSFRIVSSLQQPLDMSMSWAFIPCERLHRGQQGIFFRITCWYL